MSAPKFRIEITRPAQEDFRDILSFTLQSWGESQLAVYKDKINRALKDITRNPHIGVSKHGVTVYSVGSHRIFYRVENITIYILRILHERMDAERHLK